MEGRFYSLILVLCAGLLLPAPASASVIFKPGEKAKYIAPGEEEISGSAAQLFQIGQEAERKHNIKRAIKAYRTIVRKYPRDALAAGAGFRSAQLQEQTHDYLDAAAAYRWIVERYPTDPNFNESIEGQFRIGEMYLNGKKIKFMGISIANALDRAVEIFAAIIRTAPYGKYTARAQFDIGLAREKEGANDAAIQAYQAVVEKFPNDPIAASAQYQMGYIWFTASREGTKDIAATEKARTAFQDFLFRYPNSEKAAQARANLQVLQNKQTSSSFRIAKFYDKQKYWRAAAFYYNEVIRQQPGSRESDQAKKRLDQLRAKVGDAALQPAIPAGEGKKKGGAQTAQATIGGPGVSGSANNAAPLPPSEASASLPPPEDSSAGSSTSEAEASASPAP